MESEPASAVIGVTALRIANNRIGALLGHGRPDAIWLEADLNGKEIGRWASGFEGAPAAFTASGNVYAYSVGGILVLDHGTGRWNPLALDSPGMLIGADGKTVVFKIRGQNRLAWMPVQ